MQCQSTKRASRWHGPCPSQRAQHQRHRKQRCGKISRLDLPGCAAPATFSTALSTSQVPASWRAEERHHIYGQPRCHALSHPQFTTGLGEGVRLIQIVVSLSTTQLLHVQRCGCRRCIHLSASFWMLATAQRRRSFWPSAWMRRRWHRATLAALISEGVGYQGVVRFDPSMPDGSPRKLMDSSLLSQLGWKSRISLRDGLKEAIAWFEAVESPSAG